MTAPAETKYVDLRKAAVITGMSEKKLLRFIKATDDTHLPAKLVGGKYSIKVADIEGWHDTFPDA